MKTNAPHGSRRAFVRARRSAIAVGLCMAMLPAFAQDKYPSQPIKMVVAFPPAGANDQIARIIAPKMSQILGTPIVIENRPGANGTLGTAYVAKSKPDGYTITLASMSPTAVSPHTFAQLPYKPTDIAAVTTVVSSISMLAINPKLPVRNINELVALSKTRPVTLASSGTGGSSHLSIERLKLMSGGNFLHVPYKGAAPGITDVIGGQIDGIVMDYSALAQMVESGRLRGIIASSKVGSVEKTDHLKSPWYGVLAPANVPRDIMNKLHATVVEAMADPEVRAKVVKLGFEPMLQRNVDEAAQFLRSETAVYGELVKAAGIVPE